MSKEKYVVVKGLELSKVAIKFVLIVVLMIMGSSVMSIVYVDFLTALAILLFVIIYTVKFIPFKIKFHGYDGQLVRTVFFLMIALMLQSFATYINNAAGKTIIGIIMDKSSVAIYAFAITINSFFAAIPNSMNSVYVPKATQMILRNASGEELTDLVIKPGRIQYMFCGAVVTGFILFGRFFIHLWASQEADTAWICAVLLLVPHLFPLVQNVCLSILTAMNKRLVRSLIVVGSSIVNIIITVILVKKVGIIGAAIGTAVSIVIGNVIVSNIYYKHYIGLNIIRMYREIFSRTTLCIIIASGISATTLLIHCSELLHLCLGFVAYVIVYALMLWIYGTNNEEKSIIRSVFIRVIHKKKGK